MLPHQTTQVIINFYIFTLKSISVYAKYYQNKKRLTAPNPINVKGAGRILWHSLFDLSAVFVLSLIPQSLSKL